MAPNPPSPRASTLRSSETGNQQVKPWHTKWKEPWGKRRQRREAGSEILKNGVREEVTQKVTFEQQLEGDEGTASGEDGPEGGQSGEH